MFVITADQIGSRGDVDRASSAMEMISAQYGSQLALPIDRNSGDEIQAIIADAAAALEVVLLLTRDGHWSVGLGLGAVRTPLPEATREATGPAFIAARQAVILAKKSTSHFALETASPDRLRAQPVGHQLSTPSGTSKIPASANLTTKDVESLIVLLLELRSRRSAQGWEVVDLLGERLNQIEIAERLEITPQAVSLRIKASLWRAEQGSHEPLARLLEVLESTVAQ
jgi:hypothetical protein